MTDLSVARFAWLLWVAACGGEGKPPPAAGDTAVPDDTADDSAPPDDTGGARLRGDLALDDVATTRFEAVEATSERYAMEVSVVGDVDGDGATDVLALDDYDRVALFLGPLGDGTIPTSAAPAFLEVGVGTAGGVGDVTGDGIGDVAISGSWWVYAGPFSGVTTMEEAVATLEPGDAEISGNHYLPTRVGDLDGDGVDEFAVGGADPVAVYLFPGPVGGPLDAGDAMSFLVPGASRWGETQTGPAGDVDGDGLDDLLACGTHDSASTVFSSFVGVWRGGTGLPIWSLVDAPPDYGAASAAVAADVDGDGAVDLAVASPERDDGHGRVSLFRGPLSGAAAIGDADLAVVGRYDDEGLGAEMSAGDLDGDGAADLVLTTHGDHGGSAWLLYGPPGTGEVSVEKVAARLWNPDGTGLAAVDLGGDVTGDGTADLLVGSWHPWGTQPTAWVVPGRVAHDGDDLDRDGLGATDCDDADAGLYPGAVETCDDRDDDCDGDVDESCAGPVEVPSTDAFAWVVASSGVHADAGDLDGDGLDDLLVGDSAGLWYASGAALAGELDLSAATRLALRADRAHVLGDVDGDGRVDGGASVDGDLVVAFDLVADGALGAGDLVVAQDRTVLGPERAVLGGDLTGDGQDDLVLGLPTTSEDTASAAVVVLAGPFAAGARDVADAASTWTNGDSRFGGPMALGDVDGDGVGDLLVGGSIGASLALGPFVSDREYGDADASLVTTREHDETGHSVAIGDMDDDGAADLLVGAPDADAPHDRSGVVYVWPSSAASGEVDLAGAPTVLVGAQGDHLGASLLVRDLDGDALMEVVIGAPGEDGPGRVLVYTTPLMAGVLTSADAATSFTGASGGDGFGDEVAAFGGGVLVTAGDAARLYAFDLP